MSTSKLYLKSTITGYEEIYISFRTCLKVKVKDKVVPVLTKHHDMKTFWGCGGITPNIFDLGTRWR